ncbi:pyridoxamine 5'-phosphate oxidase family protein [Planotetraspora kaengkrachanensis]|uniref:Pyridoxamine 5'-phosphate oxidase n=1 Tax=Planotetraspora kaengkrachanensis TaxID=575193 RepID=A0A8J3PYQ0_9ACTN|nr:pyridoxamine 5'-phosphate oxidase family protein [Planotetraspora kaengkrachanensis]GIG83569.1 pyridoxamine 5'-phosphate oxidase [Planotetraspora kaengkrachanensis]
MASWQEIEKEIPDLAARVLAVMGKRKHKTMATLRGDGSPRISGIEVDFKDGEIWLGSMAGAVKGRDLKRDPRLAIHGTSDDPDESNPSAWDGDAKLTGRAVEITDPAVRERFGASEVGSDLFRVDVTEVVLTKVDAAGEYLVVEMWHEGEGARVVRRK